MKAINNKIAIVTGGTGYIGSRLISFLIKNNWEVISIIRSKCSGQKHRDIGSFRYVQYCNEKGFVDGFDLADSDLPNVVVFHLATHAEIKNELRDTKNILSANILFGGQLLARLATEGITNVVVAESYWQFNSTGGQASNSLYAASKNSFAVLLEYYRRYGIRSKCLVLYDVFGPSDGRDKLINALLNRDRNSEALALTPGEQLMDYVYVEDVIKAFEQAGLSLLNLPSEIVSFDRHTVRSMEVRSLNNFVAILADELGYDLKINWGRIPYPSHQVMSPWLPSGDHQLPCWQPEYDFRAGVRRIIENG